MNYTEQIALSSPWWTDAGWADKDRNIKAAKSSGIQFRQLARKFKIKPAAVDIIRGPRQVGKTTEIKLKIRELLGERTEPRAVGYFACDIISRPRDLFEVLKTFSGHLKTNDIKTGFFAVDEVTSVKDWQKAVKNFVDLGLAENLHLVLTGSSSAELKRGYERMPGRRNGGADYLFLPVSFAGFCGIIAPGREVTGGNFGAVAGSGKKFEKFKNALLIESGFYKTALSSYLRAGGFPAAVSDFVRKGDILPETLFIYQSVLFSEFEKYGKNIATLAQILAEAARNIAVPVSFNSMMRNLEFASAATVKEYLEMLNMAYLGLQVPCVDISRKTPFARKDKKIYFIDPVIFRILEDKFHIARPSDDRMAENAAAVHISRFFLKDWADSGVMDEVFYWKSRKGNEVDFVVFRDNKPFGFEVKYQNTVSGWDEMSIKRGIGRGILITKDTFEYGEIPKIPLWAFLLFTPGF